MIPRLTQDLVLKLARGFPIVAITGPRQAGKTTLARLSFPEREYVSLEDPEQREFAKSDPRGFLNRFEQGAIIDEAQRCPDLFSYLQTLVDTHRVMGEFILTGSQHFGMHSGISQSLAGRVGLVQLLPLSMTELSGVNHLPDRLDELLWTGGYPPLYDRAVTPELWFPNYVATYIERDVHQLLAVRDLDLFQRFVRLCAARTGQLLNLSSLANDCGISHVTAREWLNVLEAGYITMRLQPYHRNFGKRLVKTPKLYFLDTGLAAWLLGIRDARTLNTHAQRGALFENLVITEMVKQRFNQGQPMDLFFWRDNVGHEVDLLYERGEKLQTIEIKSGATFSNDWLNTLRKWPGFAGKAAREPWIIYGGSDSHERQGAKVIAWSDLATYR